MVSLDEHYKKQMRSLEWSDEFGYLNSLFDIAHCATKNTDDVGHMAPAYLDRKYPKYDETIALCFLKHVDSIYHDIQYHDIQDRNNFPDKAESLDLICQLSSSRPLGIEVVTGYSPAYLKEESDWNRPLCYGKSGDLSHVWQNQPTNMQSIAVSIEKKNLKYKSYVGNYDLVDCDLFVNIDQVWIDNNMERRSLKGLPMPPGFGLSPFEDLGKNGIGMLLNDRKTPYRKVYVVFANYWFCWSRDDCHIDCNIYTEVMRTEIMDCALNLCNQTYTEMEK